MDKQTLEKLESEIINLLQTKINDIIVSTRKNMVVVEEKPDGDSATLADIQIGEICDTLFPQLLAGSIVIQEESFDENVYKKAKTTKYIWVVDPIDGTKAFRDTTNSEWCVGICLLEDLMPILSFVFIPEPWLGKPYLLSANKFSEGIKNYGQPFESGSEQREYKYVSHIHKDFERDETESSIASLFENNSSIRAYAGHSTLAQFAEVAVNNKKVFTRRSANIWDIIQAGYLIVKGGGEIFFADGSDIFPLNFDKLIYNDNHLYMPFTIACGGKLKQDILKLINK